MNQKQTKFPIIYASMSKEDREKFDQIMEKLQANKIQTNISMENQKIALVKFMDIKGNTWMINPSSISSVVSLTKVQTTWKFTLKEINDEGQNTSFIADTQYSEIIKYFPQLLR